MKAFIYKFLYFYYCLDMINFIVNVILAKKHKEKIDSYSTINCPFIDLWPEPQGMLQKNVNVPFLSATNSTVTSLLGSK